jgi:hypothetical protein
MGVMLSLDQHGQSGWRRPGQHARHPGLPVRVQAVVALRRYDAPPARRLLTRLTRTVLARRTAPARRAARSQAGEQAGPREWSLYPGLSVSCLLGECRDDSGRPACDAARCEHDCHRDATGTGAGPAAGAVPAA